MISSNIFINNIYGSLTKSKIAQNFLKLSHNHFSIIKYRPFIHKQPLYVNNNYKFKISKNSDFLNINKNNPLINYFNYSYFNNNKFENNNIKNKNKNKFLNTFIFSISSSFFIFFFYQHNKNELNQIFIHSYRFLRDSYLYIKNTIELPFNSFVLLEKLQISNEPIEKTLILNLDKTLVCYKYSFFEGFKILQRPGLKYFISELSNYYEIIIFSNEDTSLIEYVSNLFDKNENIKYKIGNDCIKYEKGKPKKCLNYLNRDLNNTIIIDYDIHNISKENKNNTIILPKFNGNGKDRELFFILPFLRNLSKINNIQNYIVKYGNFKPYINYNKQNSKI